MNTAYFRDAMRLLHTAQPLKLINLLLLKISEWLNLIFRTSIRIGMPAFISIEPTTRCNLSCPECPIGAGVLARPKGDIDLILYQKILNDCSKKAMYLTLYFQGEPYLHKKFCEMIALAKQKKLYVATSTNAQNLSEIAAENTVKSGIDRIIISFDGPDQETYSAYRRGGILENVVASVQNLVAARGRIKSSKPYIILQCLILKGNENRLSEVNEMQKTLGADKIEFKTIQILDPLKPSDFLPITTKNSRYTQQPDGSYLLKKKRKYPCKRIFNSCVITWDGQVLPCCYDKNAKYCMGNVNENSLNEIWKGRKYRLFLKDILRNKNEIDICSNCTE